MKFRNIHLLILTMLLTGSLYAQKDVKEQEILFYLGGYGSFNHNIHIVDFDYLEGVTTCCPRFNENGSGSGIAIGGLFDIPIWQKFSLELRFGMATLDGNLEMESSIGNTLLQDVDPPYIREEQDAIAKYIIESKLNAFTLEPTINYPVWDYITVLAGLRFAYLFTANIDHREELVSPDNVTFIDGTLTRNELDGFELIDKQAFQMHLIFGVEVPLPIAKQTYLVPEFRYHYPLTNITDADWKVSTLQMGLALKLPIREPKARELIEEEFYERDTTVIAKFGIQEPQIKLISEREELVKGRQGKFDVERTIYYESYEMIVPKESKINLNMTAKGYSTDGSVQENPAIIIEEFETEEGFPLLPHVYFARNNADLKSTDMNLIQPDDATGFEENKLPWKTLELYRDMLNIVGKRMTENKNARLTITGCNNNQDAEAGNTTLSKSRAEAVKDYFTNTWNIDPARLSVKQRNLPRNPGKTSIEDGTIENQRAELSSNDPAILAPVNLKEIQRVSNPPVIKVDYGIESDAGLKNFNFEILQGDEELRHTSGTENSGEYNWEITEEPVPMLEEPVKISLTAIDNAGKVENLSKELSIKQLTIRKKRYELKDDKRIEKFSLILFDYDKAEITNAQADILKDIDSRIMPDSKVTISGYADRTGEPDYNRDLARRRIDEVRKSLDVKDENLTLLPHGSDILIYDNDKPQGRGYSRTVQIIIETPVKE